MPVVTAFNYLNDRREQLTASLEQPSYTALPPGFTSDPKFKIYDNQGRQVGETEWLTYLGTDGAIWITKCHAEYHPGSQTYDLWLESQKPDGDGNNPTFQIVDWEWRKQNMTVGSPIRENVDPSFGMLDVGPMPHNIIL